MAHPDRETGSDADMAAVNEAYRVLSGRSRPAGREADGPSSEPVGEDVPVRPPRPNPLSPDGPARFPWRGLLVAGVIGSTLVLVSAALADQPSEEPPDGIIRTDSCVVIEPNGDAREVACTGDGDIVVELLIPTDAKCPVTMEPHRDRLGLGIACIMRP
jgi:molecular chaperone DnaJ